MNLIYLTQDAYKNLKKDVLQNKEKYYSEDNSWLDIYFKENNIDDVVKTSSVVVGDVELQFSGESVEDKRNDDIVNVISFYSEYKDKITPIQASDPCLWTALCHYKYFDYILKRWKKDDGTVRLDQRYFATGGRSSLLYYNAISRLWWSGYLTYDESKAKSNPWELTKILFSAQQIQKDLFDQSFSMNRDIVKGLLRALKRIQEKTGNAATPVFRKCIDSYINHYGAVTILDALSSDEIENIAYSYMEKLI